MSFSPSEYAANLKLWVETDPASGNTGLTLTEGVLVDTWADLSGGNHPYSGSGATRPTINLGAFGPYAGVNFAGAHKLATGSFLDSSYNTACTVITVLRSTASGAMIYATTGSNTWASWRFNRKWYWNTSGLTNAQNSIDVYDADNRAEYSIDALVYDGANKTYRHNGSPLLVTPATGNLGLSGGMTLGEQAGSFKFTGQISAQILLNQALSAEECTRFERYLLKYIPPRNLVVCVGDSLTYGTRATAGNAYPAQLGTALGSSWFIVNKGIAGYTLSQMSSGTIPAAVSCMSRSVDNAIAVVWGGTNDIHNGGSASPGVQTVIGRLITACTTLRQAGFRVIVLPMMDRTEFDATKRAQRVQFNAWLADNWRGFADRFAEAMLADDRLCAAGANANLAWFDADATHLNDAGYGLAEGYVYNELRQLAGAAGLRGWRDWDSD